MTPTNPTTINDTDVGEVAADLPNVGRGALGAAGLAGVAYTLCMFFTSPDGPPVATATAQQVRDHVTSNGTTIQVAAIGGMLGITAALIFFAALTRQVRDRLPRSLLGDVVFSSGLLVVIYQWLMTTADAMTTLLPNLVGSDVKRVDDTTLRGWYGLTGFTHFMGDLAVVPMSVVMASFSVAALRGGLVPNWLSWAGLVFSAAGAIGIVGILAAVDALYAFWFIAMFGYWSWILAIAITCLIRRRRRDSPSVASA